MRTYKVFHSFYFVKYSQKKLISTHAFVRLQLFLSKLVVRFFLTNNTASGKFCLGEAVNKIYVAILVLIFFIINYIFIITNFKSKSINALGSIVAGNKRSFLSDYIYSKREILENLNLPFGLTVKKYIGIKYGLSILVFIISIINYKSLFVPSVLFLIVFFIPNVIIESHVKFQNIKLIKELKIINFNLMLQISAYVPFKDALKGAINQINDKDIRKHFNKFVYDYEVMGYSIKKPSEKLMTKFRSEELASFIQVLIQCENEGSIVENLERFNTTLEMSYFK